MGARSCSLTAGHLWSSGAGEESGTEAAPARVHAPQGTHAARRKRGRKHSSPYLLLAQEHGDMEWK